MNKPPSGTALTEAARPTVNAFLPGTLQPAAAKDSAALLRQALFAWEVSADSHIDTPGNVVDIYRLWRRTPLFRAPRLAKLPGTPARFVLQYDHVCLAGPQKSDATGWAVKQNPTLGVATSPVHLLAQTSCQVPPGI